LLIRIGDAFDNVKYGGHVRDDGVLEAIIDDRCLDAGCDCVADDGGFFGTPSLSGGALTIRYAFWVDCPLDRCLTVYDGTLTRAE
jgi:hypothetical protein